MPAKRDKSATVQTGKGKLGRAQRASRNEVRARALARDLLEADKLDDRQKSIGTKRRTGGPTLDKEPTDETESAGSGAPETDCEDPKE